MQRSCFSRSRAACVAAACCPGLLRRCVLPPQSILWDVHGKWLKRMPFLQRTGGSENGGLGESWSAVTQSSSGSKVIEFVDYRFMVELARLMRSDVFVPGERLPNGRLFVVTKGAVKSNGRIFERNRSVGIEDVMLVGDVSDRGAQRSSGRTWRPRHSLSMSQWLIGSSPTARCILTRACGCVLRACVHHASRLVPPCA